MNSFTSGAGLYRYDSTSNDVYCNLAREEYLFDALPEGTRAIILYVDSGAVVYGKHQNPWRECSVRELQRRGIPLARRISGGGTVYHDLGNLNFSFLLPKEGFDRRANLALVVRALRRVGVQATISDRHDLLLGGRKISGNAFCFRRNRALHHGTLLVRSKLEALRGALVGLSGIESFAVRSNPSPVVNIGDLHPAAEIKTIAESIAEEFTAEWGGERAGAGAAGPHRIDEAELDDARVDELERRNRTVEWLLDRTPKFTLSLGVPRGLVSEDKGAKEIVPLRLDVEKGRISADSSHVGDRGEESRIEEALRTIVGLRFDSCEIADALEAQPGLSALAGWFRSQDF